MLHFLHTLTRSTRHLSSTLPTPNQCGVFYTACTNKPTHYIPKTRFLNSQLVWVILHCLHALTRSPRHLSSTLPTPNMCGMFYTARTHKPAPNIPNTHFLNSKLVRVILHCPQALARSSRCLSTTLSAPNSCRVFHK
jgi:hypothetical protein